eukprot:3748828-Lingulodinium_polyedra.AAC.1
MGDLGAEPSGDLGRRGDRPGPPERPTARGGPLFRLIRNEHYVRNKYGVACLPTAETFACQTRHELMDYFRNSRGEFDKQFLDATQAQGKRLARRGVMKEEEDTGKLLELP